MTTAQLRYDPLGRLYELSGGPDGKMRFLYDGDELVAEYRWAGAMLERYVHGSGVDDPIVWYEGGDLANRRWLTPDHQGSIVGISSATATLRLNSYDEYGIPGTANLGRFQYTGQAWIPELRMYHYKARVYSPALGRFLQTDPVGYEADVNLYAYVENDPVNVTDPTGQCPMCLGFVIGAGEELGVQTIVQGRSFGEVDWGDVVISGAAGAAGVSLLRRAKNIFTAERSIVRSERSIQRARESAQRATGPGRRQRAAAQVRRAQAARTQARQTVRDNIEAAAAATVAETAVQEVIPPPGSSQGNAEEDVNRRMSTSSRYEIDGDTITGNRTQASRIGCVERERDCQ